MKFFVMQGVRKSALFLRYLTSLITGKGFRAKYVSGTLLQSETLINLLFLGSNDHISEIFFEDIVKTEFLGSFHPLIWGQARSRFIRPGTDIIIVPHLPWNRLTNNTYVIPAYLESKLSLPTTKDEFMVSLKGNNRRIVKQGLKNGVEFEQAGTEKDYREFYEQMFIPLVTNRHGVNAFVSSFSNIYSKAANATLIFAKLNGKRVGGVQLIWPNSFKSYSYFNKIGMINEIIHDPKCFSQVNMALYYQMCCLSIEKRYFCLNLGIVPPLLNNGLLWFKESWGGDLFINTDFYCYDVIFCSKNQREIQEHCYLIHHEAGELVATVRVSDEQMAKPDTIGKLTRGRFPGLSHINLVYPDGRVEHQY